MRLRIDGSEIEVEERSTLLDAADKAGIYIPTICHHPDLPSPNQARSTAAIYRGSQKHLNDRPIGEEFAGCRLCQVEIVGQDELSLACCTPVSDNLEVHTNNERVKQARKAALLRLLADHPHACLICAQKEGCTREPCSTNVPTEERCCIHLGNCELEDVADYIGIREDTPRYVPHNLPVVEDEPLFTRDYNLCIGCTRCVRACKDLRGVEALGFVFNEEKTLVGTIGQTLMDSDCRFCGACVEVCPTGALRDNFAKLASREADLVPCKHRCPAEVDVPRYIRLLSQGRPAEAAAVIRERLPLPNILAHSCSRPCEDVCRRKEIDEAVSICGLKRLALESDSTEWKEKLETKKTTGKRVAIIGSGPAGLSAAYYLRRMGHSVTIVEAMKELGGMMRYGIQQYRLPADIVEKDIQGILDLGVEIRTNTVFGRNITAESLFEEGFDVILMAVGLQASKRLDAQGADLKGVVSGLDFLKSSRLAGVTSLKGGVLVVGGGNVAMDSALTAIRLGAAFVKIACLEKREEMPAFSWEISQAIEEGIEIHNSYGVSKVLGKDGYVKGVELIHCLSVFDKDGRFDPTFDASQVKHVEADALILAIGQVPDPTSRGMEMSDPTRIFACGDIANGPTSLVEALTSGRKVAMKINEQLGGKGELEDTLSKPETPDPWLGKEEDFRHGRLSMPSLAVERRIGNFKEVELGFSEEMGAQESRRCLNCDLRLAIQRVPEPPKKWLSLTQENLAEVPETEGVYTLIDEDKEIIYIKGTINLRRDLEEQFATSSRSRFFAFEEAKMYTMRESEMLQQYMKKYGKMPPQNLEIEDDLY